MIWSKTLHCLGKCTPYVFDRHGAGRAVRRMQSLFFAVGSEFFDETRAGLAKPIQQTD